MGDKYDSSKRKALYSSRREAGICQLCLTPCGKEIYCPPCKDAIARRRKLKRLARAKKGICERCPLPAREGRNMCAVCAEKFNVRAKAFQRKKV